MNASKYCTKSQMSKQIVSFQGIDTCSITSFGYFGFTSVLLDKSKNGSIVMRPDINSLLLRSQRNIYISIDIVNAICARENFLLPDLSKFDDYLIDSQIKVKSFS